MPLNSGVDNLRPGKLVWGGCLGRVFAYPAARVQPLENALLPGQGSGALI